MHNEAEHNALAVLIGAGPGDISLVSQAAKEWIRLANTILYDRLSPPQLLALAGAGTELIDVGKAPGAHAMDQEQINQLLVKKCQKGGIVVRLKGGDPLIFGRGGEEADALVAAGIAFRIVPGITAAQAAASYAGIPLTDRRAASSVAFVTGHEKTDKAVSAINYEALVGIDTVVFYMGMGNLAQIASKLVEAGRAPSTPAGIVYRASTPQQKTLVATLETLADKAGEAQMKSPSLVIVGEVVKMHERLGWFEKLPMFGKTVLVTRPTDQASELGRLLSAQGADVVSAPAIEITRPKNFDELDSAIANLDRFDWLVLTSANGVRGFFDRLAELSLDARALGSIKIAVTGPSTATALGYFFLKPDLTADPHTAASLADAMIAGGAEGKKLLLARADIAKSNLPDALRSAGAEVTEVNAYCTGRPEKLPPQALEAIQDGRVDWITFTSASTVENFLALTAQARVELSGIKLAAIGPVTAAALESFGLKADVTAEPHTAAGLGKAILHFSK